MGWGAAGPQHGEEVLIVRPYKGSAQYDGAGICYGPITWEKWVVEDGQIVYSAFDLLGGPVIVSETDTGVS